MQNMARRCATLLMAGFFVLVPLLAQQNGSVTGTVTDASGAVVPNAAVTLTNESSKDSRKGLTNAEGFFTFAAVPPGSYAVSVEMRGFRKWEQREIPMNLGDRRDVHVALQVEASTGETVTVSSSLETITPVDSGEKSAVIGTKQLDNVAIVGRNAAEFIKILPGMAIVAANGVENRQSYTGETSGVNQGPIGSFSANGTRTGATDIVADGAHVIDPGCNCGQAVNMNQEMMQEVKVLTSNFGAENQKGPIVVSGVTKGGGKGFHGAAYLYARHASMNANDWYNNKTGIARPNSRYFFPGGNVGGPVLIPGTQFNKNRDKLFFFVGFEEYRQTLDNGTFASFVPTANMRNGNFSPEEIAASGASAWGGISNPPNGFPGGIVPSSQFDKNGVGQFAAIPLPNANPAQTGGYNFVQANVTYQNGFQLKPRIDWAISDNTKLYVTYSRQRESANAHGTLWWRNAYDVPAPSAIVSSNNSDSISANLTHVFNPTLTNEFIFTFTNLDLPNRFQDSKAEAKSTYGIDYKTIFDTGLDQLPKYTGWGNGLPTQVNPSGFQLTGSLYARKKLPTFADNVSKVWGTHTIKAGFYAELTGNNQPSSNTSNGQTVYANWGGGSSNNAYADTLLGRIAQYTESNKDVLILMQYRTASFYAQDSWKVNRRLTLDYGMRFDHLGPWVDQKGTGLAVWDPSKYSNDPAQVLNLTGIQWRAKDGSIPTSGTPGRLLFYSPRFGMAWDIFGTGKTVLRGGWGMYRFHDEQNVQAAALSITQGSYDYCACNGITFPQIGNISAAFAVPGGITVLDKNDTQQPLTTTYSFTISRRLPWQSLFEVSYVGNQSKYQNNWNAGLYNINAIPLGAEIAPGKWSASGNDPAFRPLANYQNLSVARHGLYQNYNALQVSWNKQSGRLNWLANYTFSKAMGVRLYSNEPNGLDINANYGPLSYDRTHIFNLAYVIQMPDPVKGSRLAKGLINGWQISGITQLQSGLNLQAAVNGNFNFSGSIPAGTVTPNGDTLTSDTGMNNDNIAGTPNVLLEPHVICNPSSGLKSNQYVNGACFAPPTIGNNGDYVWPYIKGPAFLNSDVSLFKNFQISESKKLQFRVSAYNFLNHPINTFLNGDVNLNLTFNSAGQLTNDRFGFADNKFGRRIMQLAVKFYF